MALLLALSSALLATPPVYAEDEEVDVDTILFQRIEKMGENNCPAVAIYTLTGTAARSLEEVLTFQSASQSRRNPVPVDFLEGRTTGLEGPTLSALLTTANQILVDREEQDVWKEKVLLVDFSVDEYAATAGGNLIDVVAPGEINLALVHSAYRARQSLVNNLLSERGCRVSPLPLLVGYSQGAGLSTRIVALDRDMRNQAEKRAAPLALDGIEVVTATCAGSYSVPVENQTINPFGNATVNCHTPAEQFFVISDPYQNPVHPGNWDSGRGGTGLATIVSVIDPAPKVLPSLTRTVIPAEITGHSLCVAGDLVCDPVGAFLYSDPSNPTTSLLWTLRRDLLNVGGLAEGIRLHTAYDKDASRMQATAEKLVNTVGELIEQHEGADEDLLISLPDVPDVPVDVAIVVDTTRSMEGLIGNAKKQALEIVETIASRPAGGRVAVVAYRDIQDVVEFRSRVECPFNISDVASCIAAIRTAPEDSVEFEETVYSGIMTAITDLEWSSSSLRHIVVIGDAGPKDPEPTTGYTYDSVRNALRGLDVPTASGAPQPRTNASDERLSSSFILSVLADYPAGIFGGLLNPSKTMENSVLMKSLADQSGGTFLTTQLGLGFGLSPAVGPFIRNALDTSENSLAHRPRAFLYSPSLEVVVGDEVFLSGAWSSYSGGNPTFEFDLDGDGIFELRTSQSSIAHSFRETGSYNVEMRITDEFGRSSLDSVIISVNDPPDQQSLVVGSNSSAEASATLSTRQLAPGKTTTISLTGLREEEQWGFRLVALSTDQPWSATPVYVSDVFTPAGNSDTDAVIVGEDFPLGDYRVLIATSQFLYLDAGRVTIGEDDGFIAMLFETAPPGLLAATILSFLVFIAALIAVFVQLIRRRSQ